MNVIEIAVCSSGLGLICQIVNDAARVIIVLRASGLFSG